MRDLLHLFTEGEIDPIRARLVRSHLEACGPCREERRALDEERLALVETMVKSPPLSSRFRAKVIHRILERERAERSRRRWTILVRASGLAAAAALAVGLGVALRGGGTGVESPLVARNESGHAPVAPVDLAEHREESVRVPEEVPVPVPAAAVETEANVAHARAPSFGDVLGMVQRIGPAEAIHPGEPCPPDSNRDGKVDFIDVAYACQIIMGAPAPHRIDDTALVPADPDCDEDCLRV